MDGRSLEPGAGSDIKGHKVIVYPFTRKPEEASKNKVDSQEPPAQRPEPQLRPPPQRQDSSCLRGAGPELPKRHHCPWHMSMNEGETSARTITDCGLNATILA